MTNVFFPNELVKTDDLFFVCYMIERVARQLKQPNKYVANIMGHDGLAKKHPICEVLDNYDSSAYYEPSPYITRSYYAGGF